jgi:hypothetical protein
MLQQPESPKPGPATGSGLRSLGLECGGRCRWPEHTPNTPNLKTNRIVPNVIDRPATDHCTPARASTLHCSGGQCDSWASQQELNISLLCFHSLSLLVFPVPALSWLLSLSRILFRSHSSPMLYFRMLSYVSLPVSQSCESSVLLISIPQ